MINNNNLWNDRFIEMLYRKYPIKSKLIEALVGLLSIERESVYRRLRKEIVFPVHELVKIASAWNISLDEVIGINTKQVFFKMYLWNYLDPSEEEWDDMRTIVRDLENIRIFPDIEYMEVSNRLSRTLISNLSYLDRFHLLKWMYQYGNEEVLSFSRIAFPEKVSKLASDYYMAARNVANTTFLWDFILFDNMVRDIHYFHSIYLLTDEEKEFIKKDLHVLLDYMCGVATKGCWPETGNKVNLYISQINVDTNYSYYYSKDVKLFSIQAFAKNDVYICDSSMVENFRIWMQSKKRSSVQISEVNEKDRIEFFMKQRRLVDTL
jgi:hypothetical protein